MKIVQVKLNASDGSTMTTWVEKKVGLRIGSQITLKDWKDPEKIWMVREFYPTEHEATDFDFHRGWDNNNYDKHKGLSL